MKKEVNFWEILGACILGGAISAIVLIVYFYANGGF